MSPEREATTVTLTAATGYPLADERVRETVRSAAHALAEREGVEIMQLELDGDSLTVTLLGPEIVGVGFIAELRRATESWHEKRTGRALWSPTK